MKVEIAGIVYRFWFEHDPPRGTKAVMDPGDGTTRAARAQLNPKDKFCKATGRRISLTRLLHVQHFSREGRRAIWAEYFKHHRDLRK